MAVEAQIAPTQRRLFTRAEYYRMAEVGILRRNERIELIEGEIVEMSPIGPRHRAFVGNLTELLITRLAGQALVHVQMGVALGERSDPEPDLAILQRRRAIPYKEREAHAEDVLLLIEVADSSLTYDRTTKLRLYAAARIREYWIVDCTTETVEIYRDPGLEGYRDVTRATGATTITLQVFPDVRLTVAEIFA